MDFDLIVVGAGTAGIPCAITACQAGARVAVLEKAPEIGGTLHRTGGELSGAGARLQREAGCLDDSPEIHFEEVNAQGQHRADPVLLRLAVETAGATVDWLESLGFPFVGYPAIYRAHDQYARPRAWVGEDQGLSILKTLQPLWDEQVEAGRLVLLLETRMTELVVEDGRVVGARAEGPAGRLELRAPSTVLTSGGYGRNYDFYPSVTPGGHRLVSGTREFSTGDGILAAMRVGGRFRGAELQYSTMGPIELEPGFADSWKASCNLVPGDRPPREIHVNRDGRRFYAEDDPSADSRAAALRAQPGQEFWVVFDDPAIDGVPLVRRITRTHPEEWVPEFEQRWSTAEGLRARAAEGIAIWCDADLAGLARKAGIAADGLVATVAEFNESVRRGHDPLGRTHLARPIAAPPFYAVAVHGCTQLTYGGIEVDGELQVLGADGRPIPGLYAAGECLGAGPLMGFTISGGIMVTSCISFGRLLGHRLVTAVTAR